MKENETYKFFPFTVKDAYQRIIYKNRCVLVPKDGASLKHLCGYVAFKKTDIPKDWWGDYNAPGLQKLLVHGGITYCAQHAVPNQKKIEKKYEDMIHALYEKENQPIRVEGDAIMQRMHKANQLRKEKNLELSKSDEGYVVFGFDCGHYNDEQNQSLKDPNHVMILTEQMESQLLKFKESYDDYKNAEGVIKNVVRKAIMENVHREADINLEPGFGAILEMISGEDED